MNTRRPPGAPAERADHGIQNEQAFDERSLTAPSATRPTNRPKRNGPKRTRPKRIRPSLRWEGLQNHGIRERLPRVRRDLPRGGRRARHALRSICRAMEVHCGSPSSRVAGSMHPHVVHRKRKLLANERRFRPATESTCALGPHSTHTRHSAPHSTLPHTRHSAHA